MQIENLKNRAHSHAGAWERVLFVNYHTGSKVVGYIENQNIFMTYFIFKIQPTDLSVGKRIFKEINRFNGFMFSY